MNDNQLIHLPVNDTILDKAKTAVYGDREATYGPAFEDMDRIAKMWTAILGSHVDAEDVPLCMIALKLSRLKFSLKEDSIVDIAGYAAVLERVIKGRLEKDNAVQSERT